MSDTHTIRPPPLGSVTRANQIDAAIGHLCGLARDLAVGLAERGEWAELARFATRLDEEARSARDRVARRDARPVRYETLEE